MLPGPVVKPLMLLDDKLIGYEQNMLRMDGSCATHLVGEFEVDVADRLSGRCQGLSIHDGQPGVQCAIRRQPRQREAHVAQQRSPRQMRIPHLDVQRLVCRVLHLYRHISMCVHCLPLRVRQLIGRRTVWGRL